MHSVKLGLRTDIKSESTSGLGHGSSGYLAQGMGWEREKGKEKPLSWQVGYNCKQD